MMALGMNPASPEKRRMTTMANRNSSVKGSFIGGNFIEGAPMAPETEE